jgi:hypothetical protein
MKAWQDLENNPYISLYHTEVSLWYLDMGIKIEKFDEDGRIEVKNTMTPGEMFKDLSEDDLKLFEEKGWMVGCLTMNVGVLKEKIEWLEHLIVDSNVDPASIQRRLEKNREKLLDYQQRLTKFVTP